MGAVLGWMSGRVLGQYDLLFGDSDSPQDAVYYVGPNIVGLERRHGFDPREFRLWIALHELTHRAQFTGVPWLRAHFLDLVERSVAIASPDPRQVVEAIGRVAVDIRAGRNPLAESGLVGALASPAQLETLRSIQGMMSLLEGHGDVTMDRAAQDLIPNAAHFSQVLRAARVRQRADQAIPAADRARCEAASVRGRGAFCAGGRECRRSRAPGPRLAGPREPAERSGDPDA